MIICFGHLSRPKLCKNQLKIQLLIVKSTIKMPYKFIDLFCGIGSFHYSFGKMGWECVLACDKDQTLHDVYEKNYGIRPVGDIYNINPKDIPQYDILCAGFPCQPFSKAGKHGGIQ